MSTKAEAKASINVLPGFWGLLTLVLVVAKITGHIAWSWWLVFAPLFVPLGLVLCFVAMVFVLGIITAALK